MKQLSETLKSLEAKAEQAGMFLVTGERREAEREDASSTREMQMSKDAMLALEKAGLENEELKKELMGEKRRCAGLRHEALALKTEAEIAGSKLRLAGNQCQELQMELERSRQGTGLLQAEFTAVQQELRQVQMAKVAGFNGRGRRLCVCRAS